MEEVREGVALPRFDALWDYDDPAGSERRFGYLVPAAEKSGDGSYLAQLLTQIARAQGLQRRFEEAHETLNRAESILPAAPATPRIRYLLERGRLFNSAKQPAKALPLFDEAYRLGIEAGETGLAVDAAHMIAIVAGGGDKTFEWNRRAISLAEGSSDPEAQRWLGSLYNNVGWYYHGEGQYGRALEVFKRALAWQEEHGQPKNVLIARWCVARALRSLGKFEEALQMQRAQESELDSRGEVSGLVYEEIAECLLSMGKGEEARPYFALAYRELSKDPWLVRDEAERLLRLHSLAEGS